MAFIYFGRDQYLQASPRKFFSLWPPIGSKQKLIARHSLQDCSYLALASSVASNREVLLPFQPVAVCKFNVQLRGTSFAYIFRRVAFL